MHNRKLMFVATLLFASPAAADAPEYLPVQGFLAATDGTPVDVDTTIRFALYTSEVGGTELWNEMQIVLVEQGFFTAYLGDTTALDLALFRDYGNLWLGVRIGSEPEMNRFQVASTGFAGFAQYAGDAATLGGAAAGSFLTTSSTIDWSSIGGIPSDIADGDTDTTYAAGTGLTLTGTTFAVSQTSIEGWARGVCYDSTAELRAVLDTVYAASAHSHAWSTISAMPAGFSDGTDNDTTYAAGAGLTLTGTTFDVSGVTGAMITDGTIAAADIGTAAVGADEIGAGAVGTSEIAGGAVDGTKIAANAVNAGHIATAAVGTDEIADNSVWTNDIVAVYTDDISNGTIRAEDCSTTGGLYAAKTSTYTNSSAAIAMGPGVSSSATATCNDANDLPLTSFCWTSGSNIVILAVEGANWHTTATAASAICWGKNTSAGFVENLTARIVCIARP